MSAEQPKNYETHPGSLFYYGGGVYCGVLMTEPVMRKLARLQARHLEEVKRLLADEGERGKVFPCMWTLHYPEGEQITVDYIDASASLESSIRNAVIHAAPVHKPLVFVAASMEEARAMADARHLDLHGE